MKSLSFRKDLVGVQDELLRFAYKLTTDREEANDLLQETSLKALDNEDKYMPDTNFKGWMYTIMRNIFINNYRKVVRDQTFVDRTDNLYHLNLPQDTGFESTEKAYDLKKVRRVLVSDDAGEQAEREAREVLPSVMGSDIWEAMLDEFEGARERVARLMDNHNV